MSLLNYKIIGSGKSVVLLHGFMENIKVWNFLTKNNSNFRWILIDLPGHGQSENYFVLHSMEFMAEKVKEVLDTENIEHAFFIGHSLGGYVSLAFQELFPAYLLGLCMFFSSPFPDAKDRKQQRLLEVEFAEKNLDSYINAGISLFNKNLLEELKDEIQQSKVWAEETSLKGITSAILGIRERPDRTHLLKNANFPILLLCGTFDSAIPSNQIKDTFTNNQHVTYIELPIGHMGHLEAPESCEKLVIDFFKKNL